MEQTDGAIADFIASLPKAELHVHLEGTLEPELKFELAARNGLVLPYADVAAMKASYIYHDLPSFLTIFYEGSEVLLQEADFRDLVYAYLRKAASQNVLYAEMFFDPQQHTDRGVSFATIIEGLTRGRIEAERDFGIVSQLIMCFVRERSAESAMAVFEASLPYKHLIVGVGLDSDEKGHPPVKFAEVFQRARGYGYKLTMHCDVNQENTLVHIHQVLHTIGVDRIDHGVNALEDMTLCETIRERGLGLTVCPVSNRFCVQSLTADEIRKMLALGMRATVNSDDPAYFRAYMNENLEALHEEGGLTRDEIIQLVRNAFEVAWLDQPRRDAYLQKVQTYVTNAQ